MNSKYDWALIEREYITGDESLRDLGLRHGINAHSVIAAQSRSREWVRKRAAYREGASDKAVVYMADQEGMRRAQEARVRDHAIEAIDDAIQKMREDLKLTRKELVNNEWVETPVIILRPADIVTLIDRLQVLFNRPSSITEERSLGINLSNDGASVDLLRGIVEATRGIADTGGAAESPFPRADRAREN